MSDDRYARLPGYELVRQGLADTAEGVESVAALLVAIGAPRLRAIGLPVGDPVSSAGLIGSHGNAESPELRLYRLLSTDDPDSAHGRYNALVRRLTAFERSAEHATSR